MPIIMHLAFSTKLEKLISAKEYIQHMGMMQCEDSKCRITVTHVNEYERQYGDEKINVNSYFRLKSKYFKHKGLCKYNINNQVKVMARTSDSLIDEGNNKYRINLICSDSETNGSNVTPIFTIQNYLGKIQRSMSYVNSGELPPYISTMKKIIELRTTLDGNVELKRLIKFEIYDDVTNKKKEIIWDKFYFTADDYEKMFNYIVSKKCHHVTCIEGIIKKFNEPTEKFPYYNIRLIKGLKSSNTKVPILQLVLANEEIYNYIKKNNTSNSRIAAFAIFSASTNSEYLNIKGYINTLSQIIIF